MPRQRRTFMLDWRPLWALTLLAGALLAGCSTVPVAPVGGGVRGEVVRTAYDMLGAPYRYGGDTPRGFDCSGLVYYSYRRAGVKVPRTTARQFWDTRAVALRHLRPGDLLFFRLRGRRISHVGIYIGDGKFIHAPDYGQPVSISSLRNPYWRRHFVRAGRFP